MAEKPSATGEFWAPPSPSKKRRRRLWIILGSTAAALLLILALAPTLLSTGLGRSIIGGVVNGRIAGSIRIESLSLSWFGGQRIGGLELLDPDGGSVMTVDEAATELSLWSAIRGNLNLGRTTIAGLHGRIVVEEDGGNNLLRAVASTAPAEPEPDEPAAVPATLALDAELTGSDLTIEAPDTQTIVVRDLTAAASLPGVDRPLMFSISGHSRQGDVSGRFEAKGTIEDLFASDGRIKVDLARADLTASATQLPVDAIDRMRGLRGILTESVGRLLDLNLRVEGTAEAQNITFTADSANVKIDVAGRLAHRRLILTKPATVDMTLRPGLIDAIYPQIETDLGPLTLAADVPIRLTVDRLEAPIGGFDAERVSVAARIDLGGPLELRGIREVGDAAVRGFSCSVDAESLTGSIAAKLDADLLTGGTPGRLALEGTVAHVIDASGRPQWDKLRADVTAELTGVPTGLVDRLSGQGGLLLEALGPRLDLTAAAANDAADRVQITLSAQSEKLEATDIAVALAERAELSRPATIRYTASPQLAARFLGGGEGAMALAEPVTIDLTLEKLSAPMPKPDPGAPGLQPADTTLVASVKAGRIRVTGLPQLDPLDVDGLNAQLNGASLSDIRLNIAADVSQPGDQNLLSELTGSPQLTVNFQASGGLSDEMKLSAIDTLSRLDSPGSTGLHMEAGLKLSPGFDRVELSRETTARFTVTPALLEVLGVALPQPYRITGPTLLDLEISELAAPLKHFTIAGTRLRGELRLQPTGQDDPLIALLGPQTRLDLSLQPQDGGRASVQASIDSEQLNAALAAAVDADQRFTLDSPARATFTLRPQTLRRLGLVGEGQPNLTEPMPITVELTRLNAPLSPFRFDQAEATARATIGRIALEADEHLAAASLNDTQATLAFNGPEASAEATLSSRAVLGDRAQPAPIALKAHVTDLLRDGQLNPAGAAVEAEAKLDRLPTAVAEALSGQSGKLVPLLGPSIQAEATARLSGGDLSAGEVTLTASSANLTAEAALKLADGLLTVNRPAIVKLTLTPAAYTAWMAPAASGDQPEPPPAPAFALAEPVRLEAGINRLAWPLGTAAAGSEAAFDPSKTAVEARLTASELTLREVETGRTVSVRDLQATAGSENLARALTAKIEGQISGSAEPATGGGQGGQDGAANPHAGQILADATLSDLFTTDGRFNRETLATNLTAKLTKLPVGLVDDWLGQEGLVVATLGPNLDFTATAELKQMTGPLTVRIDATHARAQLEGLYDQGAFKLAEPLVAELDVTEPLGRRVLTRIHPLFETLQPREEPIRLTVPHEGLMIPLDGFDLAKATIPEAKLDLGKLVLGNGGFISGAIGLAQDAGLLEGRLRRGEPMPAWFTPLVVELRNGTLRYKNRLDLLVADSLAMATWGDVDLAGRQLDLKLGFTHQTLRRRLPRIGPDSVFIVQVPGPIDSPQPKWADATLDLAALIAEDRAARENPLAGAIVGAVRQAGRRIANIDRIPPPSVQPLPWAGQLQQAETAQPAEETERLKGDDPLEKFRELFRRRSEP